MNRLKQNSRESFEYWLASMDEFLEEFVTEFSEEEQNLLDYSPESLEIVEKWILTNYKNTAVMLKASEKHRVNQVACYVGETFRKSKGGSGMFNLMIHRLCFALCLFLQAHLIRSVH
tara:strand:+ start:5059 stop:5409 length:351 start_codon:yes stop_codon:yes gene_type:complete